MRGVVVMVGLSGEAAVNKNEKRVGPKLLPSARGSTVFHPLQITVWKIDNQFVTICDVVRRWGVDCHHQYPLAKSKITGYSRRRIETLASWSDMVPY